MADRSVVVRLQAQIGQYTQAMRQAADSTRQFGRSAEDNIVKHKASYEQVGRAGLAMGTTLAAGIGFAAKAAIDWESAWAGVTKTVDGSPEEMAALEQELRGLAKTLPATHGEIAAVAEAAGQLGIKREAIVGFTKTMVDLGETTNLTADEAATALAKIANVMGTPQDEIDRLGSALVALGNEGASTEKEIMDMALRLAGAGKLIGASESDVLAMANAMSSVGIEAELGGGVMSRVMQKIYGATKTGGDAVAGFARIAGMSAQDFTTAFETDPVRAISSFITGLNNVEASGGNVVAALNDLGIKGTEDMSVLLRLKGAGDLLNQSLDTGASAWAENTALVDEANKRYETAASKIRVAWNQIVDFGIDVGAVVVPALAALAEKVGSLAEWFGDLPGPVKTALALLGSVGAVAGLAGGALLLMLPRIAETKKALSELGVTAGRTRGAMAAMTKLGMIAAGVAALGIAADAAKPALDKLFGIEATNVDKLSDSLVDLAQKQKIGGELSKAFGDNLEGFGDSLKRVIDPGFRERADDVSAWFAEAGGLVDWSSGKLDQARDKFRALDESLTGLVKGGHKDVADQVFGQLARKAEDAGVPVDKLKEMLPGYGDALAAASAEEKLAADATGEAGQAFEDFTDPVKAAQAALDDFTAAIEGLQGVLSVDEALIGFEQAIDDLSESIKENGRTFDISSQKGRDNKSALDNVVKSALDVADAQAQQAGSTEAANTVYDRHIGQLRKTLRSLGLNETQVERLIGKYKRIPGSVLTEPKQPGMGNAQTQADRLRAKYGGLPATKSTSIRAIDRATPILNRIQRSINNIRSKNVHIGITQATSYVRQEAAQASRGRAGGGDVEAGRAYTVGEVEPELFVPRVSGTVYNQQQLRSMSRPPAGVGGGTTVVNVSLTNRGVIGSRLEAENWLAGAMDDLRRKGRLAS